MNFFLLISITFLIKQSCHTFFLIVFDKLFFKIAYSTSERTNDMFNSNEERKKIVKLVWLIQILKGE